MHVESESGVHFTQRKRDFASCTRLLSLPPDKEPRCHLTRTTATTTRKHGDTLSKWLVIIITNMDRFVQRSAQPPKPRQPLGAASSNAARQQTDEPSPKRRKVEAKKEIQDSDEEGDSDAGNSFRRSTTFQAEDDDGFVPKTSLSRGTEIESALPSVDIGRDAIEEYEAIRASQLEEENVADGITSTEKPKWVRGKSSIYVDAFNLALDTVLEDETHLFDDKERDVFKQWRALDYEAQYLYMLMLPCLTEQNIC